MAKKKAKEITVKLVRGLAGKSTKVKAIVNSLGLRKPNQEKKHTDTPVIRGMIKKVNHLIEVNEG